MLREREDHSTNPEREGTVYFTDVTITAFVQSDFLQGTTNYSPWSNLPTQREDSLLSHGEEVL